MHEIDILLAAYQGEAFIQAQIISILNQTHSNFHLFVRDDGSTDNTVPILRDLQAKYPEKITLCSLSDTRNLGVRGNFSELLCQSHAKYVMFADQDDYWLPNKIEVTLKKMKELEKFHGEEALLLVHTDLKVAGPDLSEISPSFWKYSHIDPEATVLNRLLTQSLVTGCTMMLNRALADLSKPIPAECYMHDWWIALVAGAFGHIGHVTNATMLYRQHSTNSIGARKYGLQRITGLLFSKKNYKKTIAQAKIFYSRYGSMLDPKEKNLVLTFSTLPEQSFIKRKVAFFRCRFFKTGILRNVYQFLFN